MKTKKLAAIAVPVVVVSALLLVYLYLMPATFKPAFLRNSMERSVQAQLDASADPVYLPHTDRTATSGGKTYHSRFTTYSNWKDAYFVQSIYQGFYYQLSPHSIIREGNDGPEASIIGFLGAVKDGKACEVKDRQITDCSFMQSGLGERKFKVYGVDGYILVAEVTQTDYSFSGKESLRTFNEAETKQVEQMLTDVSPIPLVEARKSQFAYNI